MAAFLGTTVANLNEIYKQDQGGGESGSYAGSYTTTFSNTPTDPEDANITWNGPLSFAGKTPLYLLVKDGNSTPAWYLFNLTGLLGTTESIFLRDFWVGKGAISHVSLYSPGGTVPDGGSMAMLMGVALMGLAGARRYFA